MLAVTFADLWFRARQFLIAIVGVGLVLALALGMNRLADGFQAEVASTVDAVGATSWVMAPSAQGRLTAIAAFPATAAGVVATARQTVNFIMLRPGGLADRQVGSGHALSATAYPAVDSRLHASVRAVEDAVVRGTRCGPSARSIHTTWPGSLPVRERSALGVRSCMRDGF